jgi:hypothetical protein
MVGGSLWKIGEFVTQWLDTGLFFIWRRFPPHPQERGDVEFQTLSS